MALFQRFARAFGRPTADAGALQAPMDAGSAFPMNFGSNYEYPPRNTNLDLQAFRRNSLIYACIKERGTSAGEAPLRILKGEEEILQGEIIDLLNEPSPGVSSYEWVQRFWLYHDLTGNVYVHKVRKGSGAVVGWDLLRPDRMRISLTNGYPSGWVYTVDGIEYPVPYEDIAHFKSDDSYNDWYGIGPVGILSRMIDIDNRATDFIGAWIKNSGVPAGYLNVKRQVRTEAEADALRKTWRTKLGGLNRGNIAVLDSDASYTPASPMASPEMPDVRNLIESRICGVFGLDPRLVSANVGIQSSSGNMDYKQARRSFWEETLMPMYVMLGAFLTRLAQDGFEGVHIEFDLSQVRALQESEEARTARATSLVGRGMITINEGRLIEGFDPVPGGDVRQVPISVIEIPLGEEQEMPEPEPEMIQAAPSPGEHLSLALKASMNNIAQQYEPAVEKVLNSIGRRANGVIGRALSDHATSLQQGLPSSIEMIPEEADDELFEAIAAGITAAALGAWSIINESAILELVEDVDGSIIDTILANGATRVHGINATTRKIINDTIADGMQRGYTVQQIARGVPQDNFRGLQAVVRETYKGRAEAIAKTEVAYASNAATAARYKVSGITYVHIVDGTQDAPCAEANGSVWTLAEFEDTPLAHPNCTRTAFPAPAPDL